MRHQLAGLLGTRAARWARIAAIGLCLLLAAAAALARPKTSATAAGPTASVVVATRTLPTGHVLRAGDLRVAAFPRALRPADVFADRDGLVGRRIAAALSRGQPLQRAQLLGAALTSGQPPGTVAVPVDVGADLGGLVRPGDRVDVLGVPQPDTTLGTPARGRGPADATTPQRVAHDLLVLAVLPGTADLAGTAQGRLVLAAPHAQAIELVSAESRMSLTVVLDAP